MAQKVTPTAWVGWLVFAAAMLMVVGGMHIIAGLVGIFNSDFYAVTADGLVAFNYTTWGWIHLLLGIGGMLAGIGLLAGQTWARLFAIFATVVAMIGNIAFLTAFPVWSIIGLVVSGFVLYALAIHGDELAN